MPITIEEAYAVINADREAKKVAEIEQRKPLVGRYFKYRNRYSAEEEWWLYATVVSVDEWATPRGWSFQRTSSDNVEVELSARLNHIYSEQWTEISAKEFFEAASLVAMAVSARLMPALPTTTGMITSAGVVSGLRSCNMAGCRGTCGICTPPKAKTPRSRKAAVKKR